MKQPAFPWYGHPDHKASPELIENVAIGHQQLGPEALARAFRAMGLTADRYEAAYAALRAAVGGYGSKVIIFDRDGNAFFVRCDSIDATIMEVLQVDVHRPTESGSR